MQKKLQPIAIFFKSDPKTFYVFKTGFEVTVLLK
jgi:hypothetical protein